MNNASYFVVKPEQIGGEDLQTFLRKAISKQFEGREYYVYREIIEERLTPYSNTPRKLRGFSINENNTVGHLIWFDVTDCQGGINWAGR